MDASSQNQHDTNSQSSSATTPPQMPPTFYIQPPPPSLHNEPPQVTFQPPPPQYFLPPPHPHYSYHQDATLNVPMIYDWRRGAPYHNIIQHTFRQPWSTGLFDCFLDNRSCIMGTFCPWMTFGEIAEIVTQGNTPWYEPAFFYAFLALCFIYPTCWYSSCYRTRVRHIYDLQGSQLGDFVLHSLCEPCALCQVYRELQHRGFDLSIGWEKNKERERLTTETVSQVPPTIEQGMRR